MDAQVIAVESGKGGTGKSTTAAYLGAALAGMDKKVVLLELSPGLRSLDIITGISERAVFDLEDVLCGRVPPAKAVVESPLYKGLCVMPAPYEGGGFSPEGLRMLCSRLRLHFEYVIIDVAAGFGTAVDVASSVAHKIILVETADPIALRDGRTIVDSLDGNPAQIRLIINRVNVQQLQQSGVLRDLDEAIDMVGAQLLGVIPESGTIQKAVSSGECLSPKTKEAEIYKAIARRLTGEDVPLVFR